MGISFEENFKKARAKALENATLSITPISAAVSDEIAPAAASYGIATTDEAVDAVAAYDGWMKPANSGVYEYYDEYSDDKISTVDEDKNVLIANNQINLTQEKNSQYIPFEIPRFYDGFDLSATQLSIYWVNASGYGGVEIPVNVYYNSNKVSFAWLVDGDVTAIAGKIKFEIQAIGKNSLGYDYLWKTKPSEGLNVLQALEIKQFIEPDDTWQESFISRLSERVVAAETAATEAKTAAAQAQSAASEVRDIAEGLSNGIEDEVQNVVDNQVGGLITQKITEALESYYLKTETYSSKEIDEIIENIDISSQLKGLEDQIKNIDGLAAFNVEYTDGTLIFYNGEDIIKSITIPTQELIESINKSISDNNDAIIEVGNALSEYKLETEESIGNINDDLTEIHNTIDGLPEALQTDYYTKDETYSKNEVYDKDTIDEKLENVTVDLSDYASKQLVEETATLLSSSITTNKDGISALGKVVGELQDEIQSVDTSPRLTYDIVYNDLEDVNGGENKLVFYEIENEGKEDEIKTPKKIYTITGGSGPAAGSSLYIYYAKDDEDKNITQYIFTTDTVKDNNAVICYDFTGTDLMGDTVPYANAVWQIRKGNSGSWTTIETGTVYPGTDLEFNVSGYIAVGSYQLKLNLTDDAGGFASKTWTVQQIDFRIESTFNDRFKNPMGTVSFDYTPYGAIPKVIHFVLDNSELDSVNTSGSGIQSAYILPAQAHGAHLLEVYMTARINGIDIESDHIFKDIIWFDENETTPVIGSTYQRFKARQYDVTNIEYTVHHPLTETPSVTIAVNGNVVSESTLNSTANIYTFKTDTVGEHIITITCDGVTKTLIADVAKLDINIQPVTANLVFDFNPSGKSNSDADRVWSNGSVSMSVSENFDWVNGGYQYDENGDQYFCVKAGTYAIIDHLLFNDDARKNGKEFKVIFKTKNIRKRDTSFITCADNNDIDGIGLDMKVEYATVKSSDGLLKAHYCENEIIEFEFNINKDTDMQIVMSYEDGTPNIPYEYMPTSSFKQINPQPITIGSMDCDVHIYRMKAYSSSLTDVGIKNNFIADARNADEMIARYNRNQIYNDEADTPVTTTANGGFSADDLMGAAPELRYIFIEVPKFTNDKDEKIGETTVYFRYPNGTRPHDNWDCVNVVHCGQGTSSNLYGYSGRNIDLRMDESDSMFKYTNENGEIVESRTITLTDTSVPTDYLNIKVNIASSENANNAGMARRYNEYQPFLRYARKKDSRVKDTMEFCNCVVFIREYGENISEHREFNDTNWHFYGIGNVGDSKKTDDTRVNNKRDPKEHVVEITDVDKPLCSFPTGKPGHAICSESEWAPGNSAYDILHSKDYVYDDKGKFKSFGGKTYEFRYEMKNLTDEQREVNINIWRELYKFIVTSSDEDFHANLEKYFVVDSALYYYLFTERYTMVDNRAKNSFWHYGKVYISNEEALALGEEEASYYIIDDEQAAFADGYRYDLTFGYDFDTCLGIDNTGDLVFSYGKEDTDYYVDGDPSSDYIFRAADSVFFCRLRDLFPTELQAMFKDREEKSAWDANSLIKEWDDAQALFPEELWRLDYERKYYRTYLGLSIDNSISKGADTSFLIGKFFGRKKYSRRQFELNQSVYMATKYFGNQILSDVFWVRGNVPEGASIKPNYSLTLVPYSDMYVTVQYTSTGTPTHKKVRAGETCLFENNSDRMDFIYVYAASYIQEVGDLSRCYIGDNNFSSATRLQKLVIGSTADGYENKFMKNILVQNNPLLEYLDLRNISGIDTVIDLSSCGNLKELYAEGTNASGVIFANGGLLETAHLPEVKSLLMPNLNNIVDFSVAGYNKLQSLVVENCPPINTLDIVMSAPNLNTLRLTGINWTGNNQLEDSGVLDRLLLIGGKDALGYETDVSVISGEVYVPVIRQQRLYKYNETWGGLIISYGSMITQFPVIFKNSNGEILEIQYVDQGENAVDPTTRDIDPITPTIDSTISHDFTFSGWDGDLTNVFGERIITATYTESLRKYKIKYVSKGVTMQESEGLYGDNVPYTGITPTYTDEETGFVYYLFNRWDKSGLLTGGFDENGVKVVNAMFDKFEYTATAFDGRELKDFEPIEIYSLNKLHESDKLDIKDIIKSKDQYTINLGNDVNYDDIESTMLINTKTEFTGSNYIDTGIKLFDTDKDFVLAIDYEFLDGTASNSVLAQCFQEGSNIGGFRLSHVSNSGNVEVAWGDKSKRVAESGSREIVVLRHTKGSNNLIVYASNLDGDAVSINELIKVGPTSNNSKLIFGASNPEEGYYENLAKGNIYWAKIWYTDLGEDTCKRLAEWTHESVTMEVCGFRKYFLSANAEKRCSFSLLASHLLSRTMQWNPTNDNDGGWAASALNTYLNTRLYAAMPTQIRLLLKQVIISSSDGIGNISSPYYQSITSSNCYIAVPALVELDPAYSNTSPYQSEGTTFDHMIGDDIRKRAPIDGDYGEYWTRSPSVNHLNYVWKIKKDGSAEQIAMPNYKLGVLIEISF